MYYMLLKTYPCAPKDSLYAQGPAVLMLKPYAGRPYAELDAAASPKLTSPYAGLMWGLLGSLDGSHAACGRSGPTLTGAGCSLVRNLMRNPRVRSTVKSYPYAPKVLLKAFFERNPYATLCRIPFFEQTPYAAVCEPLCAHSLNRYL